jgi:flagellar assembly protein FliH
MRMRASPAKFLFDQDFTAAPDGRTTAVSVAEHALKVKEADGTGFRRGYSQAQAEAAATEQHRAAAALERIAAGLERLAGSLAAIEAKVETEAIEVAVAVARKLAPELVAREPLAELAALAADCFRHLVATPHVVVRVNGTIHAAAREELDRMVNARGLDSRLVVLVDPEIAAGDCRIEWADGGITRDNAAIAGAVGEAVTRYVDARRTAADTAEISWRAD